MRNRIQIKIQSVHTIDIESPKEDGKKTTSVGQHVDMQLEKMIAYGHMPNRVSVDLNPPLPPNESAMPPEL